MESLVPPSRDSSEITGGPSPLLCPHICISYHPLAYTVWIIYISMPGPVGLKIQVKTKGCRYCMPQYKHNLIIVTGRRYRPNIKGELLSFLHSHVCISFSHPLYLSRWVGCVVTPHPNPLQLPPFLLPSFTKQSNISAMQDCLHNRLKIKYSFLLSVFKFISHMERFFFSILGQLGLLVCIDIRALVYRRVYIVINVLALLIMRVLVFVCNSET